MAKVRDKEDIRFINITDTLKMTDIATVTVAAISAVNALNIPPNDKTGVIHRLSEAFLAGTALNYANATSEEIRTYLTKALPSEYLKHIELVAEAIKTMMNNLLFVLSEN